MPAVQWEKGRRGAMAGVDMVLARKEAQSQKRKDLKEQCCQRSCHQVVGFYPPLASRFVNKKEKQKKTFRGNLLFNSHRHQE